MNKFSEAAAWLMLCGFLALMVSFKGGTLIDLAGMQVSAGFILACLGFYLDTQEREQS